MGSCIRQEKRYEFTELDPQLINRVEQLAKKLDLCGKFDRVIEDERWGRGWIERELQIHMVDEFARDRYLHVKFSFVEYKKKVWTYWIEGKHGRLPAYNKRFVA